MFISGIPYAVDALGQFKTPVYAVFCRHDHLPKEVTREIQELMARFLALNDTLREYMRDRLNTGTNMIGQFSMPTNRLVNEMNTRIQKWRFD
jgi:hypothetical protein